MAGVLTGRETQDEAHHSKHRLQIASQYAPHDTYDDDGDGGEDGDSNKLLGPYSFDKLQPVGSCISLIEGDEPIHPVVIGPYVVGMMVSVHELLRVRVVFWVDADWHAVWSHLHSVEDVSSLLLST